MQKYWFCTDHKIKLENYTNRYSSNSNFIVLKDKIDVSLNNAIAVKKITHESLDRAHIMVNEYFMLYPEEIEFECIGTICRKCNKIFASPKNIKTKELGQIDFQSYNYWWIFRAPVSDKDDQSNQPKYYWFYFRYLLYAYILNYTLLLEMKIFGNYKKVGMYVFFPILLFVLVYYIMQGGYYYF